MHRPGPTPPTSPSTDRVCWPGRDSAQTWRSSWLSVVDPVDTYPQGQQPPDRWQCIAAWTIPAHHVGIVRRLEVTPLQRDEAGWRLPHYPGEWLGGPGRPGWLWAWNLGRFRIRDADALAMRPGEYGFTPPGWLLSILSGWADFHLCDAWQQMPASWGFGSAGNGAGRYVVQGPCVLAVVAAAYTTDPANPPEDPPSFGPSIGSMEGATVRIRDWRRETSRWLVT